MDQHATFTKVDKEIRWCHSGLKKLLAISREAMCTLRTTETLEHWIQGTLPLGSTWGPCTQCNEISDRQPLSSPQREGGGSAVTAGTSLSAQGDDGRFLESV